MSSLDSHNNGTAPPALPPGITPADLAKPYADLGPSLIAQNVIMTIATLIVVGLRMFCRKTILKTIGVDDYFILAATALAVSQLILTIEGVHLGLGKHIWTVSPMNQVPAAKVTWAIQICYPLALGFVKLSLLSFYTHLCPPSTYRKGLRGLFVFIILMTIGVMCGMIIQCLPLGAVYRPEQYPNATCVNRKALHFSAAGLNILTDILILVSPMPFLLQLILPRRQTISLILLFSLGGFVCVASMVRLHYIQVLLSSYDQTWTTAYVAIWSCMEVNLGIIAASVPGLKPLFAKWFPNMMQSVFSSSPKRSYGSSKDRNSRNPSKVPTADVQLGPLRPDALTSANTTYATHFPYSSDEEILHDGIGIQKDVVVTFARESSDENLQDDEVKSPSSSSSPPRRTEKL